MGTELEYISVTELLEERKLRMPNFQCINNDPATFRILRMQPRANFQYDVRNGPRCNDRSLIEECRSALHLAKKECSDLVLFPEYCMPYSLLQEILSDAKEWPDNNKLWCLPCQAISNNDFFTFLEKAKCNEEVVVLDQKCISDQNMQNNFFINALFYCFITTDFQNQKKLVLLPQMKLHPMRDVAYLCEGEGLTTGGILYYFSGESICLFSLICADVYHDGVSWDTLHSRVFQNKTPIILHPQLNSNPREHAFSRLRRELMDRNQAGLYITSNWAAGTCLQPANGGEGTLQIDLSWSCIYRKYGLIGVDELCGKKEEREGNLKKGVCTGMISRCRTSVWFTDSQESLYIFRVEAPQTSGYPVANQYQACKANGRYVVKTIDETGELTWKEEEYNFSLIEQMALVPELKKIAKDLLSNKDVMRLCAGDMPFKSKDKEAVDCFFTFATALCNHPLELDGDKEVPIAWTLFLNKDDVSHADKALMLFFKLCKSLETNLPPRLREFQGRVRFAYFPQEPGRPVANLKSIDLDGKILAAFAETEYKAKCYLEYLKKNIPCEEELYEKTVCIFYEDVSHNTVASIPEAEIHITCGDAYRSNSSITNGGADD